MLARWFKAKYKTKRLKERAIEKHKDYMRPVRITERLKLRIDEAVEIRDKHKVEVLLARARRVRDFQIREWGH